MKNLRRQRLRLYALILFSSLVVSVSSPAFLVNRLNGGASIAYVDVSIPGASIPLELSRTYNSITSVSERTGWDGAFGWGWVSPFETTLTTTPERHVLLRDGTSGNSVIFKPQRDADKDREFFMKQVKRAFFERQKGKKLTDTELAKMTMPEKVMKSLETDPAFRAKMAADFGIKNAIAPNEPLVSAEYGFQTVTLRNRQWVREKDGISQFFDSEGRLVKQLDKNGFALLFKYSVRQKMQLEEVSDVTRSMTLRLVWRQNRIVEAVDNRGNRARYTYDAAGNLVQVTDAGGQTYVYKYENKKFPHLLTRIDYPGESTNDKKVYRELRYDEFGLATFQREKDGVEISYTYGRSTSDPENNFWTKAVRKAAGSTDELYDEYTLKAKPDGSKYLHKQENKALGVTTSTVFSACCGKPLQVTRNGEVTNYKYYDSGLLKERIGPKEEVRIEYDDRWKKVSKILQNGITYVYRYDERGNLTQASTSNKTAIELSYDKIGRIIAMTNPEGQKLTFRYGALGKPEEISEKGVGAIRIEYNKDGRIKRTTTAALAGTKGTERKPSDNESQEIVRKVMKSFQQLLDIIRPAGAGLAS